ncbi:hypothetical protein QVD17_31661 [Tagetes erecta]|uniref:Uncharacterized protein n=1 Tax=Tagetes erecta TaxID=13708 RepID=A0AAD8K4P1_TARER|nr:hypothetical protein QVD17_31661 [Tagetes erecta]
MSISCFICFTFVLSNRSYIILYGKSLGFYAYNDDCIEFDEINGALISIQPIESTGHLGNYSPMSVASVIYRAEHNWGGFV